MRAVQVTMLMIGTVSALLGTGVRAFPLQSAAQHSLATPKLRPALRRTVTPFSTAASLEAAAPKPTGEGVAATTVGMAKNIVGSGVLALAAGVAAFSGSKLALVPSLALLFAVGGLSAYSFSLIARVGDAVGGKNYRDTWAKVFGEGSAWLPDATVVFMTMVAGLCFSIILGEISSHPVERASEALSKRLPRHAFVRSVPPPHLTR